jgi:hypothetical protein
MDMNGYHLVKTEKAQIWTANNRLPKEGFQRLSLAQLLAS